MKFVFIETNVLTVAVKTVCAPQLSLAAFTLLSEVFCTCLLV